MWVCVCITLHCLSAGPVSLCVCVFEQSHPHCLTGDPVCVCLTFDTLSAGQVTLCVCVFVCVCLTFHTLFAGQVAGRRALVYWEEEGNTSGCRRVCVRVF